MKAHVYVTLKRSVLDAQGQTVAGALRRMEYPGIADVRQGKYFLLTLEDALAGDPAQAQLEVERTASPAKSSPTPSLKSSPSASKPGPPLLAIALWPKVVARWPP